LTRLATVSVSRKTLTHGGEQGIELSGLIQIGEYLDSMSDSLTSEEGMCFMELHKWALVNMVMRDYWLLTKNSTP
jgi:hypothetical protein